MQSLKESTEPAEGALHPRRGAASCPTSPGAPVPSTHFTSERSSELGQPASLSALSYSTATLPLPSWPQGPMDTPPPGACPSSPSSRLSPSCPHQGPNTRFGQVNLRFHQFREERWGLKARSGPGQTPQSPACADIAESFRNKGCAHVTSPSGNLEA